MILPNIRLKVIDQITKCNDNVLNAMKVMVSKVHKLYVLRLRKYVYILKQ